MMKTLKLIFWFIILLFIVQDLFGKDIGLIHYSYKDYFPVAVSFGLTSKHANQCNPHCFNQQNNGDGFRIGPLMYMQIVNSMEDSGTVTALKTPDFGVRIYFFKLVTAGMISRVTGYKTPDEDEDDQTIIMPMIDTKAGVSIGYWFGFDLWLNYHYLPLAPGVDTNRWTVEFIF